MINLLGAQDVHKCNFDKVDGDDVAVPIVDSDDIENVVKKWISLRI